MNQQQMKNLSVLANFMEELNDPNFTMQKVFHSCGTPACAFGYALKHPYFKAQGLIDHKKVSHPMFGGEEAFDAVFYAYHIKTPQQWATHCRAFLKTHGHSTHEGQSNEPFKKFLSRVLEPVEV